MTGLDANSREVAASVVANLKLPPLGIPPRSREGGCQLGLAGMFRSMTWFNDFRSEVREKTRVSDLALISSVPILLSLVFLLPESIQNALILDYGNYSIINLWSSAFVHRGFNHFNNNLAACCILIGPIYLLFVLANERKLFRYTFLAFLFILPFVIALSNIAALGSGTGRINLSMIPPDGEGLQPSFGRRRLRITECI